MGTKKIELSSMESLSHFPYRQFGSTQLRVSPICFGSLRLTPENEIYKESLRTALKNGINFIDSSGSYGDGASELLIGDVIQELSLTDQLHRDQLVISTKIGTLHGKSLVDALHRDKLGNGFPDLHQITGNTAHCISPEYIEHQLTTSLRRLNLKSVDVVFIQSPEMMLLQGQSQQSMLVALKKAFEHLEVEVMKGRIKYYGLASRGFLKKDIAGDHLSLKAIYEIAHSIRENHHFAALQVPFNLFETQALQAKNQDGKTLFQMSKELGLATVTCRPLTSNHRNKLHHFITYPERDETKIKGELHQTLLDVLAMEKEIRETLTCLPTLDWGHYLKQHLEQVNDLWKWTQYSQKHMLPRIIENLSYLPIEPQWEIWKNNYLQKMRRITKLVTESLESISNLRTNQISKYLTEQSEHLKTPKLSNKVTQIYLSFEEIDSIIMGLGSPRYVEDLLNIEEVPSKESILHLLKEVRMRF